MRVDACSFGNGDASFSDTFSTGGPVRTGAATGCFLPYDFRDAALLSVSIVSPNVFTEDICQSRK
jgi:hypothetical protein